MTYLELKEILLSEKPSEVFTNEKNKRAKEKELFNLIPELRMCKGFNQNNEWHPYDVLEHTYRVVDGVDNNLILRLAALFHDVGKPYTYTEDENGVGHFKGHWKVSKDIFLKFAKKCHLDSKTRELVSRLIYYHDLSFAPEKETDDKNKKHVATAIDRSRFTKSEIINLYRLKKADILAQNPKFHEEVLDRNESEEEEWLMTKTR